MAENETLNSQLAKTSKRDIQIESVIRKKLQRNDWLLKELQNHRETDSTADKKPVESHEVADAQMVDESSEAVQRRKEQQEIQAVIHHFQDLSSASFRALNTNLTSGECILQKKLNVDRFRDIQMPLLEQMMRNRTIGELAF